MVLAIDCQRMAPQASSGAAWIVCQSLAGLPSVRSVSTTSGGTENALVQTM